MIFRKKRDYITESGTDYDALYKEVFDIIGDLTPLGKDCGVLCDAACCKGGDGDGMILFPHEKTTLKVTEGESGRLAVCSGTCDRCERPLACRIFPFFPAVDERGGIHAEIDPRAVRICPIAAYSDQVIFDRRFIKAVKKAGELLALDAQCRQYLISVTEEMDMIARFYE